MYLIDTNIFLEILLTRLRTDDCKKFLEDNAGNLNLSVFSFHSIGVILFKEEKEDVFLNFLDDVLPEIDVLDLPSNRYKEIVDARQNFELDFDDAYQYCLAKHYNLKLVTLDSDFSDVQDIDVVFL